MASALLSLALHWEQKGRNVQQKIEKGKLPGRLDAGELPELGISMGSCYAPQQQLLLPNWPGWESGY